MRGSFQKDIDRPKQVDVPELVRERLEPWAVPIQRGHNLLKRSPRETRDQALPTRGIVSTRASG